MYHLDVNLSRPNILVAPFCFDGTQVKYRFDRNENISGVNFLLLPFGFEEI